MIKYNCTKCGKEFSQKSKYDSHMKRKTSCVKKLKYIDLFCGMGSFHYSFQKFGFECVMASDIYEPAKETYYENFKIKPNDDICLIDPKTIKPYDILCAGFPCQPFSQCGKQLGFDDERGTMFFQVMKFVKENVPKIVILENVKALLKHDNGNTFNTMKSELEEEGYDVIHKILVCSDYGIPQMRNRLFIIGFKNITVKEIGKFFDLSKYEKSTTLSKYLGKKFEKDTAYTIRCGGKNSPINDRHNWDGYWVDKKEYRLTIEDGLKLQGFSDYNIKGRVNEQWKMLGNTIPTIFTEIIGKQIIKHCVV